jgi:hypothetical protein
MFPIVGMLEETRGMGKGEENDRVNNIEIHLISVGTRHTENF